MKLIRFVVMFILAVMVLCSGVAFAFDPFEPQTIEEEVEAEVDGMGDEIDMLAKLIYREARGVNSTMEQAAVVWCVLNRVDDPRWADTICGVVTARGQFAYRKRTPVMPEFRALARDVVTRWLLEKHGVEDVGRVLPADYVYFAGRRGRNWFRTGYRSRKYWSWDCDNPYEN